MQTSYYANRALKDYAANGHNLTAISQSQPAAFVGMKYPKLAPSWALVNDWKRGIIDWQAYTTAYYESVLDKLSPGEVLADVGLEAILLCYERPDQPCHRHIVADWIQNACGIFVTELNHNGKVEASRD